MSSFIPFREVKALVNDAVPVLGERWVALGAGCSLSTVQIWRRCRVLQLRSQTVERILPRLRCWESWVPAYQACQVEQHLIEKDPRTTWEDVVCELGERLSLAGADLSTAQMAYGCEVWERLLRDWRIGDFREGHFRDAIRALGHLRHLYEWPVYGPTPSDLVAPGLAQQWRK